MKSRSEKFFMEMGSCTKTQSFTGKRLPMFLFIPILLAILILFTSFSPAIAENAKVKVMTRNLYLGADIFRVVAAANSENPLAVPMAVKDVFQTMQHTNFVERAEAIADEIQLYKPHLIGLQEVSTIRMQAPGDFLIGNPTPAEAVVYDYITILQDALAARGLNYQAAATVTNADVELPMLAGQTPGGMPIFNDVRLTDHDVILVRDDVVATSPLAQNFTYNAEMAIGGAVLKFTRGYVAVDVEVKGESFRFVNTHLEVGGDPGSDFALLQAAQMQELLYVLSFEPKPVILVGDFNSSPEDVVGQPYSQAVAAGYTDIWEQRRKPLDGFTCCFNETVDDSDTELYERIDHIFLLPQGKAIEQIKAKVAGDESIDMTANGLWPSDHAGVIGKIEFVEE